MDGQPDFLPRAEHIAYLANLLTVLGILYAAWLVYGRRRRANAGQVPYGPDWSY